MKVPWLIYSRAHTLFDCDILLFDCLTGFRTSIIWHCFWYHTTILGHNCSCFAKLSPLPKYRQLRVAVTSVQPFDEDHDADDDVTSPSSSSSSSPHKHNHNITEHGHSTLFVLTDVATVSMLTNLYKVSDEWRMDEWVDKLTNKWMYEWKNNPNHWLLATRLTNLLTT